jgi:HEAT repeat protein
MKHLVRLLLAAPALLLVCPTAAAQPMPFEDVVRNLRNPDPEIRVSALRLLVDARYPEAAVPIAALINDAVDEIQLEAIYAELSFVLIDALPARSRKAFIVELRNEGRALKAFQLGPLAVWPTPAPPEIVKALLQAVDDETQDVRVEAAYALGVIGRGPLAGDEAAQLIKALDHYDPSVRVAAARVVGRRGAANAGDALIRAMHDSNAQVRHSAMRALGETGESRAVQALTDQFTFYGKGAGASSALSALARIADPSSVPLFTANLENKDPHIRQAAAEGLGRVGDKSEIERLQTAASNDESDSVRAACAFALQKLGWNYLDRLVDFLDSSQMAPQVQSYLLELGSPTVARLLPRLLEPDEGIRRHLVEVLGGIGDESTVARLTPLLKDRDKDVAKAAKSAIERIKRRLA